MITPILRNDRIKIRIRLNYIKAVLLPVILYGSEVWYQNRKQIKALDGLYLESLRMVMGCSKVSPNYVLLAETNMRPLFTIIVKNRAVTYAKWFNLNKNLTSSQWLDKLIHSKRTMGRSWNWLTYSRKSFKQLGINYSLLEKPMTSKKNKKRSADKGDVPLVGGIFDIETFIMGERDHDSGDDPHREYITQCLNKACFELYLKKLAKTPSSESYRNYLRERGSLKPETYLSTVKCPKGCKILFKARSNSLPIGERIGSHGLSGTSKCTLCAKRHKETLFCLTATDMSKRSRTYSSSSISTPLRCTGGSFWWMVQVKLMR